MRLLSICHLFATVASIILSSHVSAGPLELFQKDDGEPFQVSSHSLHGGDAWSLQPGQKKTFADITGPAVIRNIWFTCSGLPDVSQTYLRDIIIRMYWDGEDEPSVETPFGDFFGCGFSQRTNWQSKYLGVTSGGFYCYFPMPFTKNAYVEIENTSKKKTYLLFFHFLCQRYDKLPPDTLYFHAQYRRENPTTRGKNYTVLKAEGSGYFAGITLAMQGYSKGDKLNFLEGDEFFYIDGREEASIKGTGTEDYFQGGWYFIDGEFNGLYHGLIKRDVKNAFVQCYRFHFLDRINFEKSILFDIEHGQRPNNEARADYSSVAYWYQNEPHQPFEPLPENREPTVPTEAFFLPDAIEWEGTPGTSPMYMSTYLSGWSNNIAALFTGSIGKFTEKKISIPEDGVYKIGVNYIRHSNGAEAQLSINGDKVGKPVNTYSSEQRDAYLLNANHAMGKKRLGEIRLTKGEHIFRITMIDKDKQVENPELIIDCITVTNVKHSKKGQPGGVE